MNPMYLPFYQNDPNFKSKFKQLYENHQFEQLELVYLNDFNSKSYFQKKFGAHISKTKQPEEVLDRILYSLEKVSQTKVFSQSKVDFSPEENGKMILNIFLKEKSKFDYGLSLGLFNHKNEGNMFFGQKLKLFLRSPFELMDNHKFEYTKGWYFDNSPTIWRLASSFPYVINENSFLKFQLQKKNQFIDSNIEERTFSQKISIVPLNKMWNFSLKRRFLQNHLNITKKSSQYVLDKQIFPNQEYSLNYKKIFYNTKDDSGIVETGKRGSGSMSLAFNDNYSNYLKIKLDFQNFAHFFDPSTQKNIFLRYVNFENNFKAGIYIPLQNKKPDLLNNFFSTKNKIIGFENIGNKYLCNEEFENPKNSIGDFKRSQILAVNNVKINFHDYPFLKMIGIVPFIHLTGAFSFENYDLKSHEKQKILNNFRFSSGIGFKIPLFGENFMITYNIIQLGQKNDIASKFQFFLSK